MRSKWIEHKGQRILFEDFANLFYNSDAFKQELAEVQQTILGEADNSVLAIIDFTNTEVDGALNREVRAFNKATQDFVRRAAIVGIGSAQRFFGDVWSRISGGNTMYFATVDKAKDWLVRS